MSGLEGTLLDAFQVKGAAVLLDIGLPIVTFLIGGLVGHRLALGRDKRKEFNEFADPLKNALRVHKESLSPMDPECIGDKAAIELVERAPIQRRGRIERAIKNYQDTHSIAVSRMRQNGFFAEFQPEDAEELTASIDRLLVALKRW